MLQELKDRTELSFMDDMARQFGDDVVQDWIIGAERFDGHRKGQFTPYQEDERIIFLLMGLLATGWADYFPDQDEMAGLIDLHRLEVQSMEVVSHPMILTAFSFGLYDIIYRPWVGAHNARLYL